MHELSLGVEIAGAPVLGPGEIAAIEAAGQAVQLRAGAVLYRQGEAADAVWYLGAGRVRSVLLGADGQETVLRLHLPGSLLGLSALGSARSREADGVVTADARLSRLPVAAFEALMASHPGLARRVVRLLVDRLRDYHHRVGEFAALPVRVRLARTLLALCRAEGGASLRITHAELAALTQARRPTVSAELGALSAAGCVAQAGRTLEVVDAAALARVASGRPPGDLSAR